MKALVQAEFGAQAEVKRILDEGLIGTIDEVGKRLSSGELLRRKGS